MSHAWGYVYDVKTKDFVGYYEYDGTSDIVLPTILKTSEELVAQWRRGSIDYCKTHEHQDAYIVCSYGWDHYWEGSYCPTCMLITSELARENIEYEHDGWPVGVELPEGTVAYTKGSR